MTETHLKIHPQGLSFSRIVPGMMRLNEWGMSAPQLLDWLKAVLDMGLTTFDHADIYGGYTNEARFGEALRLEPSLRQKMQIVTKCGIQLLAPARPNTYVHHYDTTRAHIVMSVERSLQNLQTDVIDLLLIHRPDPLMQPLEVAAAFDALAKAGKVRTFGVSNFSPSQFNMLQSACDVPLVTNQVEFSVLYTAPLTDGTFDQALSRGFAPMIWSPLGGGRLFSGQGETEQRLRQTLIKIGKELNAPVDQVALAWTLMHPVNVLPVMGTGKLERLQTAVAALQTQLTRQQWFAIWEAAHGHEVP